MLNDREMGVKVLKQREGTLGKVMINWDFETMNFTSIYSETSDNTVTESEEDEADNSAILGIN